VADVPSANVNRRHIAKGQRAMAAVMLRFFKNRSRRAEATEAGDGGRDDWDDD